MMFSLSALFCTVYDNNGDMIDHVVKLDITSSKNVVNKCPISHDIVLDAVVF